MKNRKKTPSLVLNQYFKSISQIFWYSKFYLFHAIASYLHFANARKQASEDFDLKFECSNLLLATLSIPEGAARAETFKQSSVYEKNIQLLSSGGSIMDKSELISNLLQGNYLDFCDPAVKKLFLLYAKPKDILRYSKIAQDAFESLRKDGRFNQYLHLVERNLIIELINRLGKLYKSISFATFEKYMGFFNPVEREKIILYYQLSGEISVCVDYTKKVILFSHGENFGQKINHSMVQYANELSSVDKSFQRIIMKNDGEWNNQLKRAAFQVKDYLENIDSELKQNQETLEKFKEKKMQAGQYVREGAFVPKQISSEVR